MRRSGPGVAVLMGFGLLAGDGGLEALAQGRVVAQLADTLQPDGAHRWTVHGEAGQAVVVSKPELVDIDIRTPTGEEVFCGLSPVDFASDCVVWLASDGAYRVAISHRGVGGDARGYEILLIEGDPYPYTAWSATGALYHAVTEGRVELVQALIDRGGNVDETTSGADGFRTPLNYALEYTWDREMVRILLANGADPDSVPRYGVAPLVDAVHDGDVEMAGVLLEGGADPSARDDSDTPVLAIARESRNDEMAQLLMEHGADEEGARLVLPGDRVVYGDGGVQSVPRLIYEIYFANTENVLELLALGADPDATDCAATSMHGSDCVDTTPALVLAAALGEVDMVAGLLAHGADPDAISREDGGVFGAALKGTALMHAARSANDGDYGYLGGKFQYSHGELPARGRRERERSATVGLLLAHDADPNLRDERGCMALMYAVRSGNAETARLLRAADAEETGTCFDGDVSAPSAAVRPPGIVQDCSECPQLVAVPEGRFSMGSGDGEDDEVPVADRQVRRFAIGRYEVTREEFGAFVAATGYQTAGGCWTVDAAGEWNREAWASWREPGFVNESRHPVVCASWVDAQAYVDWLGERTGREYRLPSEAEWEYAARGGTVTERYWGDGARRQCEHANGADQTLSERISGRAATCRDEAAFTAPVGSFRANGFGLFDMLGNVWEWVADCWHSSYAGAPSGGEAWTDGASCRSRMLRGGSWSGGSRYLRSAGRNSYTVGIRMSNGGFRVARGLD